MSIVYYLCNPFTKLKRRKPNLGTVRCMRCIHTHTHIDDAFCGYKCIKFHASIELMSAMSVFCSHCVRLCIDWWCWADSVAEWNSVEKKSSTHLQQSTASKYWKLFPLLLDRRTKKSFPFEAAATAWALAPTIERKTGFLNVLTQTHMPNKSPKKRR